jgi:hypothetical protein
MATSIYNPGNPFDTGRPGEENTEVLTRYLQQGRRNELLAMGWDPNAPLHAHDNPNHPAYRKPSGGTAPGIPGGALIAQAQLAAKQRYQQRLADLTKKRQGVARTGGYKFDVGDDGLVKNWRVDPYNQYGTFQLLNRQQARQGMEVQDANLARGLGTRGGLAAQNLNDARFEWGQQDAALGQSLVDQLGALDEEQQAAKYELDQALWQLQLEALRMAAQDGDYGYPGSDYPMDEDGSSLFAPVGTDFSVIDKIINKKAKARVQSPALTRTQRASAKLAAPLKKYGWGAAAVVKKPSLLPHTKTPVPKKTKGGRK